MWGGEGREGGHIADLGDGEVQAHKHNDQQKEEIEGNHHQQGFLQ